MLFPAQEPALALASILALIGTRLIAWRRLGRLLPATPLDPWIALYLFFTGLAFLLSPLPTLGLSKLTVSVAGVAGYYLVAERLEERPAAIRALVVALAVAAGMLALTGLFTLEWPSRQVIEMEWLTSRLPHLSGPLEVNGNEMAGTLLLLAPFPLAWLARPGRPRLRPLPIAVLLLVALVFLLTQSRGAVLGLMGAALAWLVWGRLRLRWLALLAALLVLLFAFLARPGVQESGWPARLLQELDAGSKTGDAISWLGRLEIWRAAGQMLLDYPVVGAGLYTFDPVSRANYVYEVVSPGLPLTHAHNLWLEMGATAGWPGMLAFAGLWATAVAWLWRAGGRPATARLPAVFGASLSGYLTFSLFDVLSFGQRPGFLIWLVLAGAVALGRPGPQAARSPGRVTRPAALGRAAPLLPLLLLAVLALSPAMQANLAHLRLDRSRLTGSPPAAELDPSEYTGDPRRQGLVAYHQGDSAAAVEYWRADPGAAEFLMGQGSYAASLGQAGQTPAPAASAEALEWYDLALSLRPGAARIHYYRGLAHELAGRNDMALSDYRIAERNALEDGLPPELRARIAFDMGRLLAAAGEWPLAAAAYRQAILLVPDVSWYHQALGDALTQLGDPAGAAAAYEQALSGS
jgi:O-antigen ligase